IGLRPIVGFVPRAARTRQVLLRQDGQVLGDGGLGYARIAGQGMDGLFALPCELLEEGAARRVGKGTKQRIGGSRRHAQTITKWLWFVNAGRGQTLRGAAPY